MNYLKLLLLYFLSVLIQVHTTVTNNTITSWTNAIQNTLFKKIQKDSNLFNEFKDLNSITCFSHFREILGQIPRNLKAVKFFDSWGKIPAGLLQGHTTDLGNYDECVQTSLQFNGSLGDVNGQYCFAAFDIPYFNISLFPKQLVGSVQLIPDDSSMYVNDMLKTKIGICIPDSCSAKLLSKIFQIVAADISNGIISGVSISNCSVKKKPDFESLDIFAIFLFSIIGTLIVLSTIYDFYIAFTKGRPSKLILIFSLMTNGKKLFTINAKSNQHMLPCLNGIRSLSLIWILYLHCYIYLFFISMINMVKVLSWSTEASSMPILMGNVSVDSFFFLSGLLLAWHKLHDLEKSNGKPKIIIMWIHRYIRLTPALAALILYYMTFDKFIGSGPFRQQMIAMHDKCHTFWWATLFYIQNYANSNKYDICIGESWYLAADTQLYFLSPLILIPLWKWGKKFIPVMVLLSALSVGCTFATFYVEGYTELLGFNEGDRLPKVYFKTHIRYPAWMFGVGFGYFMYVNREKTIRPSKMVQILGWTLSMGIMVSIIFGPYYRINSDSLSTVTEAAAYESLKRIGWSIALAWIVFACHFGFGGFINSILSHPFWQPFTRMSYSFYLVQLAVISIIYGSVRTDLYFSNYQAMLNFISSLGITFVVAMIVSLAFESPVIAIQNILLRKMTIPITPKPKTTDDISAIKEI